jgi:RHS repeat-associated protein
MIATSSKLTQKVPFHFRRNATITLVAALLACTHVIAHGNAVSTKNSHSMRVVVPSFSTNPADGEFFYVTVLPEPLVPSKPGRTEIESNALASALLAFYKKTAADDVSMLLEFLKAFPGSRWEAAIQLNLGIIYRKTGHFSDSISAWKRAWELARGSKEQKISAVGHRAIAELSTLYSWIGEVDEIEAILEETAGGDFIGMSAEQLSWAKEAAWMMRNHPELSFKCGPFALARIRAKQLGSTDIHSIVDEADSTPTGFKLSALEDLAGSLGMDMVAAKMEEGGEIVIPSVVHWNLNHYSAILEYKEGKYLIADSTFDPRYGPNLWVSKETLLKESSGYFLISESKIGTGWRSVPKTEAEAIHGKGLITTKDVTETKGSDAGKGASHTCNGGCPPDKPMAQYRFHTMLTSLQVFDTPISYAPPRGPPVELTVAYNQREAGQPANMNFSNFGQRWTFTWLSYVQDDPATLTANVTLVLRGGGQETYSGFSGTDLVSDVHTSSGMQLTRSADTNSYERVTPSGEKAVFGYVTGSSPERRIFLSHMIDAAGNTNSFEYDSVNTTNRLVRVIDSLGGTNTLAYSNANPALVTHVTDRHGRTAQFSYSGSGMLTNITDPAAINSSFDYSGDFMTSLTTPYGSTSFEKEEDGLYRSLMATDPQGAKERLEYRKHETSIAADPVTGTPSGMITTDTHSGLDRNSFYWDKLAMRTGQADLSKAHAYHWIRSASVSPVSSTGILYFEKPALENRLFYNYGGQVLGTEGTNSWPVKIGRFLGGSTNQLYQFEYNSKGNVVKTVDPIGRTTIYNYETNGIDLLDVRQILQSPSVSTNLLASFTYNSQHLPTSSTDAAGQITYFGYNGYGQLTSVTNALSEITALAYDSSGFLTNVTAALPGASTSFTYTNSLVRTITDSEGYTITFDYDAIDRITKVTFPDGSTEETVYDKLDPVRSKDRLGRWTKQYFNSVQQLVGIQDALGRTTSFEWCKCGSLEKIVDPLGKVTQWYRDIQGRVTQKVFPDDTVLTYAYESATSRLRGVTDAKGQTTTYSYFNDNNLAQISFSGASETTPTVSYAYDPNFNRLATLTDGIGTTTNIYNLITGSASLGAGRLGSVDGPFSNDTIAYTYDALGRIATRSIDGIGQLMSYDSLGRIGAVTNALGSFSNTYVNTTHRLSALTNSVGMASVFSYLGNSDDQRLSEIHHKDSGAGLLSKFNYEYNTEGRIAKWTQYLGSSTTNVLDLTYDHVDQLLSATLKNAGGAIVKKFAYAYDRSRNRTSEQIDNVVRQAAYNDLNQLTAHSGGGKMFFKGIVNEAADVAVTNSSTGVGLSANVFTNSTTGTITNAFEAHLNMQTGTNQLSIVAKDFGASGGNVTVSNYVVNVTAGASSSFTYDLNGNLTSSTTSGITTTYAWDGADRLVRISTNSVNLVSFTYDGLGRRSRMINFAGATATTNNFLWCGLELCELRDHSGGSVEKRFFPQGEQFVSGGDAGKYFYTRDHLGSVREMIASDGTTIKARYDYDPWGRTTKLSGTLDASFGFTGHYYHAASALHLAPFRAYSAEWGRFINRDPIQEDGGLNLYAYTLNDPVNNIDPDGLSPINGLINLIQRAGPALQRGAHAAAQYGQRYYQEWSAAVQRLPGHVQRLFSTPAGNRLALGVSEHIDEFAKAFSAQHLMAAQNFRQAFMASMNCPNTQVYFNLADRGGKMMNALQRAQLGMDPRNLEPVNWELAQIMQNPQWWNRITFVYNGSVVANPFAK